MGSARFLALEREKIGTKLYGYVLAKSYSSLAELKVSRSDFSSGQQAKRMLTALIRKADR